jgi:hypothetical protein
VDPKTVSEHDSILRAIPRAAIDPKSFRRAAEDFLACAGEEKRT